MTATAQLRPIGTISLETRAIVDRLAIAAVGDLVSYGELSDLIGRSVQGPGRSALETARRIILRRDRIVFGVIMDVGLKRLNDEEMVDTGYAAQRHVRRHARRSMAVLLAANYEVLPVPKQAKLNGFLTGLRMQEYIASEKTIKRIEAAAVIARKQLSMVETLEAFKD